MNKSKSPNKKIRIGVAGAGMMGSNHVRILNELGDYFELVGVYDPVPERAKRFENIGIKGYTDYDELLNDIEAITLPCPTSLHKVMALKAAEKGVHALVEKPIAENYEDAKEIVDAFAKKKLVLTVGQIERFNPVIKSIADYIKERHEDIAAIEVHRCSPFDARIYDVDVVSDLMIHDIDIVLNAICNSKTKDVDAIGIKVHGEKFVDYAQATVKFENGPVAFITSSRCTQDKIRTICLHAKDMYIEGDMLRRTITIKHGTNYEDRNSPYILYKQSNVTEHIALTDKEPLREEMKDFGETLMHGKSPEVTGEQVLNDMKMLDNIKEKIYREVM